MANILFAKKKQEKEKKLEDYNLMWVKAKYIF